MLVKHDNTFLFYERWHLWPYRPQVFSVPNDLDGRLGMRLLKANLPYEARGFALRDTQVHAMDSDVGRLIEVKAEYQVLRWVDGARKWMPSKQRWEQIYRYEPVKQFFIVTEDGGREPCAYSALVTRTDGYPGVATEHMGRFYLSYRDITSPMTM